VKRKALKNAIWCNSCRRYDTHAAVCHKTHDVVSIAKGPFSLAKLFFEAEDWSRWFCSWGRYWDVKKKQMMPTLLSQLA